MRTVRTHARAHAFLGLVRVHTYSGRVTVAARADLYLYYDKIQIEFKSEGDYSYSTDNSTVQINDGV